MKTNTVHPSALAARVAAFNRAHAEVNRLAPLYRALFAEYIGQHVTTAKGDYLAKIRAKLPQPSEGCQVYSPHVGCFVVKTAEVYGYGWHGDTCTVYADPYFYAFTKAHDGTAQALGHEFEPLRCDYTPETVQDLRKAAEDAREVARQAESACGPFGLVDR